MTRPTGSPKYGTTRKNTQRYYTTKRLIRYIYYKDTTVLLENTPLVKFIRNYIRDSSGVFSTFSIVKISMISLISSLSLKLYLNSLVYDRNIFRSSLKVFVNLREMFRNVRLAFGTILENLRKTSESGRKSSQNRQKRRHQYAYIIKHFRKQF